MIILSIIALLYIGLFIILYHRKIFSAIYSFVRHREIRFFLLSMTKFGINIGASAMLYKVGISGIILSINGYYIERFLK